MVVEGKITRDGRWYIAELPLLDGLTQGRSKKEALAMAADWVASLAPGKRVEVTASQLKDGRFVVESDPPEAMIALALRRRREAAGLSLSEVAERIGAKSRNAYARYEQGESLPTITKLAQLFHAVDPERRLTVTVT